MTMNGNGKKIGRGLSSLLGDVNLDSVLENTPASQVRKIPIDEIRPDKNQPRKYFKEESINELANSIEKHGLLQPIIVKKDKQNGYGYIIISGERRWRACKQKNIEKILSIVKENDPENNFIISIIENIQRDNLSFSDEINAYKTLINEYKLTHEDLSQQISKSRSYITNMIRISKLPDEIIELIKQNSISMGHAKILAGLDNPIEISKKIIKNNFSVRQLESFLKESALKKKPDVVNNDNILKKTNKTKNIDKVVKKNSNHQLDEVSKMISKKTGLNVNITSNDKDSGFLNIVYSNKSELEDIINKLIL